MDQNNSQSMTIDDLAIIVKTGFADINARMATKEDIDKSIDDLSLMVKGGFDDITHQMADMAAAMATKEDLTNEIGKLRSDMIDYIAKQNMELKGDLVVLLRGEDRKLFALIEIMVEKNLLSKSDANRVTRLEPFPQGI